MSFSSGSGKYKNVPATTSTPKKRWKSFPFPFSLVVTMEKGDAPQGAGTPQRHHIHQRKEFLLDGTFFRTSSEAEIVKIFLVLFWHVHCLHLLLLLLLHEGY